MTREQIKAEFNRWLEAGRPDVWIKANGSWHKFESPSWDSDTCIYIIDDIHSELRKLQIDKYQELIKDSSYPDYSKDINYQH